MSFITDIVKFGLGQFGIRATGDTPKAIVQSAVTNFLKDKVNSAFKKSNPNPNPPATSSGGGGSASLPPEVRSTVTRIEREVKREFKADQANSIPIVYGETWVEPQLVDAVLTNNNCTMWYCVALSEMTGDILSTGVDDGLGNITYTPSEILFEEIILNDKRMVFRPEDGVTLDYLAGQGETNRDVRGLVKVYPYAGGSENPVPHSLQFDTALHGNAYDIFPNWGSNHQMSNLVFALIRVDYDAVYQVTGIGGMKFKLKNTIKKPGDVVYDYMTNTLYGAGVTAEEIDT
jgi:hypothetical protein